MFAASVEKAILSKDLVALNAMFDWDASIATATAGIEASEHSKQGFATGFKHAQTQKGGSFSRSSRPSPMAGPSNSSGSMPSSRTNERCSG